MSSDILANLNPEQHRAVTAPEESVLILAGAGSGKTRVLTTRIAWLLEHNLATTGEILAVTFTNKAAKEMLTRLEGMIPYDLRRMWVGTFHGLCNRILRIHAQEAGLPKTFQILDSGDQLSLVKRLMKAANIDVEKTDPKQVVNFINWCKENGLRSSGVSAKDASDLRLGLYQAYERECQKQGVVDFAELLLRCYELLTRNDLVRAHYQKRFRHILVDEFQDTNVLQYRWLKILAGEKLGPNGTSLNAVFAVGDDDQSIYGFRGARPDIMLSFPKQYKSLERVTIGGNYRCTSQILRAATALIRHNKKRYDKKLLAMKGSGELVHVAMYQTPAAQAEAIAKKIQQAMEQGTPPEQIALLFRTARQMNIFSRKFMEYNIPFVMKDSIQNIFEHWVAKDVLSYMKMAMGDRSRNLFLKVANRPKRYLSRAAFTTEPVTFGSLYDYYRDKAYMCERINDLQNDLFAMKQMTPYSAIDYLYHTVGYKNFLAEYAAERGVNVKDWEEIVEEIREDASGYNDFESWFSHIEEYGKQLEERKQKQGRQKSPDDKPGVALMTMHSAKGLEFDIVFIPDANEGMIPYRKSVEDGQIEEERRLMYVAMTRAREHLYLSYVKQRFQKEESPSRFLKEIEKSINFL